MKNPNFIHKLANALILLTILSFFLISSYAIENDGQKIPYDTWTINNLDEFEVPPQEKLNDIDLKLIDEIKDLRIRKRKTEAEYQEAMVRLIEALREQNLNRNRLEMLNIITYTAIKRYLKATEYARFIEDFDRRRLFNGERFYEIVEHALPDYFSLANLQQKKLLPGWALILANQSPLQKNCNLKSITLHTLQGSVTELEGYVVILTPVEEVKANKENAQSGAERQNADDVELQNLDRIIENGGRSFYQNPIEGYRRIGKPYHFFLVKKTMAVRITSLGSQEIKGSRIKGFSIDGPMRCQNKGINNVIFSKPLIGFKGDYVALLVSSDDFLAYSYPPKNIKNVQTDSYYPLEKKMAEKIISVDDMKGLVIKLPDVGNGQSNRRAAAFTCYGEYLLPPID